MGQHARMAIVISLFLTALGVLDVVLTRLRMRQDQAAGRTVVPLRLVDVHTAAGSLAIVLWVVMHLAGDRLWGALSMPFWWVATLAGLGILTRWLPARGRRSSDPLEDSWSKGPGLSILAHVGMLVGVL